MFDKYFDSKDTPEAPETPKAPEKPAPIAKVEKVIPKTTDHEQAIKSWKKGDKINLTGVDGHLFNKLNDKFKNDKSDRGFRFNYDQDNEILTVVDDK